MLIKIEKLFVNINKVLIGIMMFLMFSFVFTNVITRYLFGFSINWSEELSRFLMIAICFIGSGLAMREKRHVAIELFVEFIPSDSVKRIIRIINGLIILAFMGLLAYLGMEYAGTQMAQKTTILRWNMGYIYWMIPIGAVVFILHLVTTFKDYIEPRDLEEDIEYELTIQDRGGEK